MDQPPCIAIVDDSAPFRIAVENLLRAAGLEAQSFASAEAYLTSDTRAVACLVCDVDMPGMSGLDLQTIVAALNRPPDVIFATAQPLTQFKSRALAARAFLCLQKPFDGDLLIRALRQSLASQGLLA